MREFKTETFEGYCDFLSAWTSIDIKYQKVYKPGDGRPYAVAVSSYCENAKECPDCNHCPLYTKNRNQLW